MITKVLSVRQPWASLLVAGVKDIENRSWSTTYRGRLAIHASQKPPTATELRDVLGFVGHGVLPPSPLLPRGAIIGTVELLDVRPAAPWQTPPFTDTRSHQPPPSLWAAEDAGFWWMVSGGPPLPAPIVVKGLLGLWEYDVPVQP